MDDAEPAWECVVITVPSEAVRDLAVEQYLEPRLSAVKSVVRDKYSV